MKKSPRDCYATYEVNLLLNWWEKHMERNASSKTKWVLKKWIAWDILVYITILISLFEIPYEQIVHFTNEHYESYFNNFFCLIFGVDIIVNCFSVHEERTSGLFGWRNIFHWSLPNSHQEVEEKELLVTQPEVCKSYLTSGWFIVDFLSAFPYHLFFQSFGLLGMARILRLFRLIRLFKTISFLKSFSGLFELHPSYGRFVKIVLLVPLIMHFLACVLYYFEKKAGNESIAYYSDSLHLIYVTFTSYSFHQTSSSGGFWTIAIAIIASYIFFGVLIGNFASLFENRDHHLADYENEREQWQHLFKNYPRQLNKKIRTEILQYIRSKHLDGNRIIKENILVESLPQELEEKVLNLIGKSDNNQHKVELKNNR